MLTHRHPRILVTRSYRHGGRSSDTLELCSISTRARNQQCVQVTAGVGGFPAGWDCRGTCPGPPRPTLDLRAFSRYVQPQEEALMAAAHPTDARPAVGLAPWQLRTVLTVLLTGQLLSALDQTIVGTALPTMVGEFGQIDSFSLVVTSYL